MPPAPSPWGDIPSYMAGEGTPDEKTSVSNNRLGFNFNLGNEYVRFTPGMEFNINDKFGQSDNSFFKYSFMAGFPICENGGLNIGIGSSGTKRLDSEHWVPLKNAFDDGFFYISGNKINPMIGQDGATYRLTIGQDGSIGFSLSYGFQSNEVPRFDNSAAIERAITRFRDGYYRERFDAQRDADAEVGDY